VSLSLLLDVQQFFALFGFLSKLGMTCIDMADTTHLLLSKTPFEERTA
jgi:hypothetical protein